MNKEKITEQTTNEATINICGDVNNMKGINKSEEIELKDFGSKMLSADGIPIPQKAIITMVELINKYNLSKVISTITKSIEELGDPKEVERESFIEINKFTEDNNNLLKFRKKEMKTNYTYIRSHCNGTIDGKLHDVCVTAIVDSIDDMQIICCRKIIRRIIECIVEDLLIRNPDKEIEFDKLQDVTVYSN